MNKIRDIIYDYNDIFVALLIIVIAGAMLLWRVNAIMEYPEYLAANQTQTNNTKVEDPDLSGLDLTTDSAVSIDYNTNPDDANSTPETPAAIDNPTGGQTTPAPTGDVKFEVPKGSSASKIADLLRQAGLIDDQQEFLKVLTEKKADTKLKAGTFTIPAGSTVEEIINILTK